MYVNPFWFGVICTIVVEIVGIILWALIIGSKDNSDKK